MPRLRAPSLVRGKDPEWLAHLCYLRYPEELADRAWDNVGLLQENIDLASNPTFPGGRPSPPTVLLTNDLTIWVAEEAIRKKASVIVSYRESAQF